MSPVVRSLLLACAIALGGCATNAQAASAFAQKCDVLIRAGTVYDGSGKPPVAADVCVVGDVIAAVGDLQDATAGDEIDATGLAVSPGFINVLSWADVSLIADGRGQSDIRQGVTLEVFGEGWSMGPLNQAMKIELADGQGDTKYDVSWTTLGEYLQHLEDRGVSPNVASFVGATTVREHVLGHENRAPTDPEMRQMQALVAEAMKEGALGVGSALTYVPGSYAGTDELIALAKTAGSHGGTYISHIRSHGSRVVEAVEELITIAEQAGVPAQIYHLNAAGEENWSKLDQVIDLVEAARARGLEITANLYVYTAGAAGLEAAMPPWVQEGGHDAWVERLKHPAVQARLREEIATPSDDWDNLYLLAGSPEKLIFIGFENSELAKFTGKTLAEVAAIRGTSPEQTMIDLVIEDNSRVATAYVINSEDQIRKKIGLPWVTFGSDAGAYTAAGSFLDGKPHPRGYGNFARLLGRYVRDENLLPLEEAIRRLTSFPAESLRIERRGRLAEGYHADIAIFDPGRITDHATFTNPHQYATGMVHVLVNGVPVLRRGEHTDATPGRYVRGPGWLQKSARIQSGRLHPRN